MFEQLVLSVQQDIKLFIFFPILCAIFRYLFIKIYSPYKVLNGKGTIVRRCFRYGFWWGMTYNAYAFLIPFLCITVPSLFFPQVGRAGDSLRLSMGCIYAVVLYIAFVGKLIFYRHFHDIYNHNLPLVRHAEKHNLLDIFFHQDHGAFLLFSLIPYSVAAAYGIHSFLLLPSFSYASFSSLPVAYLFNTGILGALVLGFFFFKWGGTLNPRKKKTWAMMPGIVKKELFFANAAADDLLILERVFARSAEGRRNESDAEALAVIRTVAVSEPAETDKNPLYSFKRVSKGARIKKPSHIFLFVGESYLQQLFDPAYDCLHVVSGGKRFREDEDTLSFANALSAGLVSRPSIVSLMSGIFDMGLELNELKSFWNGTVPTSLPLQLKKLGYRTAYWYGGSLKSGNFDRFAPACGFDRALTAVEFCAPDAPRTWVGVYDNVFLKRTAELIEGSSFSAPEFHFIYTTSYHAPFKIDVKRYGYQLDEVMPEAPQDVKRDSDIQRNMSALWFADHAIGKFIERMRRLFPDSLFILTGDHAINLDMFSKTSLINRAVSFREQHCPVLMINHCELTKDMFAGNTIASHMNIMPTIMELIAPKGFAYYSLLPALTEKIDHIVSPYHWLRRDAIGSYDHDFYQPLGKEHCEGELLQGDIPYKEEQLAFKSLTRYMVRHPELLRPVQDLLQ